MNSNLLFDFSVNKENKTIHVKREFAANLDLVWKAWTTAELLDQWWAPKPYRNQTKSLDFREGGHWLYAMISPKEEIFWCKQDYKEIDLLASFSGLDAFCDESGNINPDFPRSLWENHFSEEADSTTVNITISYDSLADLEKTVEMGFKEGFTMGMQNLDELLLILKK
ncbi:MAG: SRPBCC domain-containing protein [Sphingobacteriia bacterium]|nr:SRPBCC domain-containing protein [Sphingobacteriia bacterium]